MGHGWKGCDSALPARPTTLGSRRLRSAAHFSSSISLNFVSFIHLIFQTVGTTRHSVTALLHLNRKLRAEWLLVAAMLAATCLAPPFTPTV